MKDSNKCKKSSCCSQIAGYVVFGFGVVASFMTQSWEAGTLGLFIIAAVLIRNKHHSVCNGCGSAQCCCGPVGGVYDESSCVMPSVAPKKAPVARKKAAAKKA